DRGGNGAGDGGAADPAAVRELTDRIAAALRSVTVNLEDWSDAPLVEAALDVWEAEYDAASAAERVARLERTTSVLRLLRETEDPRLGPLVGDVAVHERRLRKLRLRPRDLGRDTRG